MSLLQTLTAATQPLLLFRTSILFIKYLECTETDAFLCPWVLSVISLRMFSRTAF